jgi:hypothetical protein
MNSDDFEKLLQQQSIRSIPGEWRQEILQKAKAASVPQLKTHDSKLRTALSELFWPCRQAWIGMAAIWLLLLVINSGLNNGKKTQFAGRPEAVLAMLQAMQEQKQLLTELIPPTSKQPAEPPRRNQPQPRSETQAFSVIG